MTIKIIGYTLTPALIEAVSTIASKYQQDPVVVADIMSMLATAGLRFPSLVTLRRTKRSKFQKAVKQNWRTEWDKVEARWMMLHKLLRFALFSRFVKTVASHSLEEATDKLVALLTLAAKRHVEGFCLTCSMLSKCAHGRFIAQQTSVDGAPPDDCPRFVQAQPASVQQMQQGVAMLTNLLHPANVGAVAPRDKTLLTLALVLAGDMTPDGVRSFDATFTGMDIMQKLHDCVTKMSQAQLAVLDAAQTLDVHAKKGRSPERVVSSKPSEDLRVERMQSLHDLPRALPSQLAQPAVLRDYKIATSQIAVRKDLMQQGRKQCFHLLVDVSGSMRSAVAPNANGFFTRGHTASALALATVKKMYEEKGILYLRFFTGAPDILHRAKTASDLVDISRMVGLANFDGDDTNIQRALMAAFTDIKNGKDEILRAEVLLVTDGESRLDFAALRAAKANVKLHVLEVRSTGNSASASRAAMQQLADSFMEVDPTQIDFAKIAKNIS